MVDPMEMSDDHDDGEWKIIDDVLVLVVSIVYLVVGQYEQSLIELVYMYTK